MENQQEKHLPSASGSADPHARRCKICNEGFGHAWGGVGLAQHYWKVHGIPSFARFNGKIIHYG